MAEEGGAVKERAGGKEEGDNDDNGNEHEKEASDRAPSTIIAAERQTWLFRLGNGGAEAPSCGDYLGDSAVDCDATRIGRCYFAGLGPRLCSEDPPC